MTSDSLGRYLSERIVASERRARLRPMTSGEILDQAMGVYRALGWSFLKLSLVPSLFCLAAYAFFTSYVWPAMQSTRDPGSVSTQLSEAAMLLALSILVGGPLFLTGLTYITGLVVGLAANYLVGRPTVENQAQRDATEYLPRIFLVVVREFLVALGGPLLGIGLMFLGGWLADLTPESSAVAGVVTLVGVVAALGGIGFFLYVVAAHSLVVPIAILERLDGAESARRSRRLMKGSKYHVPGTNTVWSLYSLMVFIAAIIQLGSWVTLSVLGLRGMIEDVTIGLPMQSLLLSVVDLVPAFLMVWALVPIWATTITVIYFERRIRMEGYDIDVLASHCR
ncbi:MAG TPA: hypothetical protein VGE01_04535 [Fimbriimonas sp.]